MSLRPGCLPWPGGCAIGVTITHPLPLIYGLAAYAILAAFAAIIWLTTETPPAGTANARTLPPTSSAVASPTRPHTQNAGGTAGTRPGAPDDTDWSRLPPGWLLAAERIDAQRQAKAGA